MTTASQPTRTPADWFHTAARCYIDNHQGCPSCGRQHCVFQSRWAQHTEYHCSAYDFFICHDRDRGQYFASEGDEFWTPDDLFRHLRDDELV